MKWTIGYITSGTNDVMLQLGIDSVQYEVPDCQLVIVGGDGKLSFNGDFLHVPFDESIKPGWITRKKNLVAQNARYENICIMHDYVELCNGWHAGCELFGENWLTCMHKVVNNDGSRFRDWCVIYNDSWMEPPIDDQQPSECVPGRLLKYTTRGHERWQYYSGAYFCTKRSVLLDIPFDENRAWGQGEDVQWCRLIYQKYGPEVFQMNPLAMVHFLKQKDRAPWEGLSAL